MTNAHIFTPADNSLEARIQSLKSALRAQRDVELSQKLVKQKQWADMLGSPEEVHQANEIISNGLKNASASLSPSDIKQAVNQGLLSPEESQKLTVMKRQEKMKKFRNTQQSDASDKNSFKR